MTFLKHVSRVWQATQKAVGECRGFSLLASEGGVVVSGRGSSGEIAALTEMAKRLHRRGDCPLRPQVESSRRYDRQGEPEDDDDLSIYLVAVPGRFDPEPKPQPVRRGIEIGFLANRRVQAGLNENLMDACDDVREQIERFG